MAVLNELKPGLDEKLYENALVIELAARGLTAEQQREFPVHYRGHFVGRLVPDLIVEGKVIADPKVVTEFNDTHTAQMLGYLNHRSRGGSSPKLQRLKTELETHCNRATRTEREKMNHGFH
jgi:GxxExxY protein